MRKTPCPPEPEKLANTTPKISADANKPIWSGASINASLITEKRAELQGHGAEYGIASNLQIVYVCGNSPGLADIVIRCRCLERGAD